MLPLSAVAWSFLRDVVYFIILAALPYWSCKLRVVRSSFKLSGMLLRTGARFKCFYFVDKKSVGLNEQFFIDDVFLSRNYGR